jgi:phosphate/sulfate permease
VTKVLVKDKKLYQAPKGSAPPPFWIRSMLVLTCTGVSFAHGSNDGQKGMGLIMLILVGTVPAAYALNHAVRGPEVQTFVAVSEQTARVLSSYASPGAAAPARARGRQARRSGQRRANAGAREPLPAGTRPHVVPTAVTCSDDFVGERA